MRHVKNRRESMARTPGCVADARDKHLLISLALSDLHWDSGLVFGCGRTFRAAAGCVGISPALVEPTPSPERGAARTPPQNRNVQKVSHQQR
jgi:hypothetical protein